jgi:hypothetical protein
MNAHTTSSQELSPANLPAKRSWRWQVWVCLIVLLVPLSYCLDLHLVLIGYLRNEPCYRLRPASYWRAQIQSKYRWIRDKDEPATRLAIDLLMKIHRDPTYGYALLEGDQRGIPVLLFLAKDSDEEVRQEAITLLAMIHPCDERTIAPIIDALEDESPGVRAMSLAALDGLAASDPFDPRARAAVPRLIRWANENPSDSVPRSILNRIHPELKPLSQLPNGRFKQIDIPKH